MNKSSIEQGMGGAGFQIVYGFLPDFGEEASGLLTYFYRIVGRRLPDFLRIFTGLWGGGFRIVYGFFPDFWGLPVCLRIFSGFWGGGFRIADGI